MDQKPWDALDWDPAADPALVPVLDPVRDRAADPVARARTPALEADLDPGKFYIYLAPSIRDLVRGRGWMTSRCVTQRCLNGVSGSAWAGGRFEKKTWV